jgi:hypothetical protein
MVAPFHNQVRLDGFDFQDAQFTVKLATGTDTTFATIAGPIPLTWDSSAANQMKVAGDGDPIHAVLVQVENRLVEGQLVGMATFAFSTLLSIKAGLTGGQVVATDSVLCGAAGGYVRAAVSGTDTSFQPYGPRCVEVRDSGHAVAFRP